MKAEVTGVIAKYNNGYLLLADEQPRWMVYRSPSLQTRIALGGIGGHVETGESAFKCLQREIGEETAGGKWNFVHPGHTYFFDKEGNSIQEFPTSDKKNIGEPAELCVVDLGDKILHVFAANCTGLIVPRAKHPMLFSIPKDQILVLNKQEEIAVHYLQSLAGVQTFINNDVPMPTSGTFLFTVGTARVFSHLEKQGFDFSTTSLK